MVRKAKRDTDQTSESECDSGKENQRHSRILSHPRGSAGKKMSKDTKPKQSDWWSNLHTLIFICAFCLKLNFKCLLNLDFGITNTSHYSLLDLIKNIIMFTPAQILNCVVRGCSKYLLAGFFTQYKGSWWCIDLNKVQNHRKAPHFRQRLCSSPVIRALYKLFLLLPLKIACTQEWLHCHNVHLASSKLKLQLAWN